MKIQFTRAYFLPNEQKISLQFEVCIIDTYFKTTFCGEYSAESGLYIKSVVKSGDAFDATFARSPFDSEQMGQFSTEVASVLNCHYWKAKAFQEKTEGFLKEFFRVETIQYAE